MEDHTNETEARLVESSSDGLGDDDFGDFAPDGTDELRLFADLADEPPTEHPTEHPIADTTASEVPAATTDVSSAIPTVRSGGRRTALVIVGVVGVLAAALIIGEVFKTTTPVVTAQTVAAPVELPANAVVDDDFERDDASGGLGVAANGKRWDGVLGDWGVDRGAAYIADANGVGALRNMAIVDLGSSDGSIAATLSGRGVCGVIVRYSDPFNYITLKRVSLYGVWNLEKVVGAETTRLTYLADPSTPTVDVRVDFRGSQFDVFVAGTSTTINDTAGQTSTLVGLIGEQIESRDCRWSSFRGWNLGSDA